MKKPSYILQKEQSTNKVLRIKDVIIGLANANINFAKNAVTSMELVPDLNPDEDPVPYPMTSHHL